MKIDVYNPQKGRLETIHADITDQNTSWFEDCENNDDVYMITDFEGCLLVSDFGYNYPILIYDASRKDIEYDRHKAFLLKNQYL